MPAGYRHLEVLRRRDVTVLRLVDSRLLHNLTLYELDRELEEFVEQMRPHKLIVDFQRVDRCSTSVINSLLRARNRLIETGCRLRLSGMNDIVRGEFQMLGLEGQVFEVHDTEAAALEAFDESPDRYRHFKVQYLDDAYVLHLLDNKLEQNVLVSELDDELAQFLNSERPARLLVNFGGVSRCSTAVINSLLRVRSHVQEVGGRVKLCGVNDEIRGQLIMLELDSTVFEIYESAGAALADF